VVERTSVGAPEPNTAGKRWRRGGEQEGWVDSCCLFVSFKKEREREGDEDRSRRVG